MSLRSVAHRLNILVIVVILAPGAVALRLSQSVPWTSKKTVPTSRIRP